MWLLKIAKKEKKKEKERLYKHMIYVIVSSSISWSSLKQWGKDKILDRKS